MEKYASFPMNSARFRVFPLAISCLLICLSFYVIWVIKANPPFHQETHFYIQFNPVVEFKGDLSTSSIPKDTNFNFNKAGKIPDIRASDAVTSDSRGAADEIKMVNNSSNVASFDSNFSPLAVKYYIPPAGAHSISIPGINPLDLISKVGHPQDKDKKPPDLRAEVHNGNEQQDVSEATSDEVKTLRKNKKNSIEEWTGEEEKEEDDNVNDGKEEDEEEMK